MFATGGYDTKIIEINNERVSLDQQLKEAQSKSTPALTLEPIKNVFLEASRAMKDFTDADDERKRKVIEKLLWNFSIKNRTVAQQSFKSPYSILAKSPKTGDIQTLCRGEDSNLHGLLRVVLSHVRLPISPPRHDQLKN